MAFHTWPFFLFFTIVYIVYLSLKHTRLSLAWLLLASYVFYGWWNPYYLVLIFYATLFDYAAVYCMSQSRRKGFWLGCSIANNVLLLGFFKYYNFLTENLNWIFSEIQFPYQLPALDILLPIGISFYIFKSLSYVIDCYREEVERESSFIRHALYVSFFPQVAEGPIERAKNLLVQFRRTPAITKQDVGDGISLFVVGLFKKAALANYLALYVDRVYATPDQYQSPALILATLAFGWQLYFDFSGYTDMARGIARLMGFQVMLNFNHPYLAAGFTDFWARWHISLSNWLRDYIFTPLIAVGKTRNPRYLIYRNVLITFLVSGLWHGAAWTFIIWGILHAGGILLTMELDRRRWYKKQCPRWIKQLGTYILINFTWIFFRAESVGDAGVIVSRIVTPGFADPAFPWLAAALTLAALAYQCLYESRYRSVLESPWGKYALVCGMLLYLSLFPGTSDSSFVYFQF